MALRRRTKVSAKFNMSSMTDIVFLLLIFFMVTSTLVHPNAIKLVIPKKSTSKKAINTFIDVRVSASRNFYLNGKRVQGASLEGDLQRAIASNSEAVIRLRTDKQAATGDVARVLDIAETNGIKVVLDIR
jgi:biopolymer transport protein ExbD